tara:strand:+ start:523 stop:693 length:171 start_codon:yes stop_codon:yes gene_type:complete
MHTQISNNKRQQRRAARQPVSTLTHTTREVAEHFLKWREKLRETMIGHNGGPKINE